MRALWSGSISFGLINIPVRLFSASRARALNFKLLEKHSQCEIQYVRICAANHKEVPYQDIVRGYEYKKGDYVVLTDEDFKKAQSQDLKNIDIVSFAKAEEIDAKFYEKPYYLEPDKKAQHAYSLLSKALEETKTVAIAKFVLHERQHLAAIKSEDNILVLNQLRFLDEIRPPKDLSIPKAGKIPGKELSMAKNLIAELSQRFQPEHFKDTYTDRLLQIIQARAKGRTPPKRAKEKLPHGEVFDLMSALKSSLEKTNA
jgi:DNA end-binding protein Ku